MLALPCNNFHEGLEHNLKVGAPTNPTSFSYRLFEMNESPPNMQHVWLNMGVVASIIETTTKRFSWLG